MKVGYFPCTQDPPKGKNIGRILHEVVAEAQAAEEAGFDGCFVSEHHQQEDGYLPNPLLMAGLIGMKTSRIRVGTCVLLLPLYHPVHVAEDCAVIDQATKGRLVLSVGVGYQPQDFAAFGIQAKERVVRTEEGVAIIRKCWRRERFSFSGKVFRIDDALITPEPYQKPGPPIWFAAWTARGLDRTARLADGWITDPIQSLPIIKGYADRYREAAAKYGKKPFVCLMRDAVIARSREAAEAEAGPTLYTHRFYFRYGAYREDEYLKDVKTEEELTFEKIAEDRLLVGTPEEWLDQIKRWQEEIHPDYLILRLRQPGGPPHERVIEALRLLGEKVIPRL
jgi:alkanesulfonate monooxygenase SsuD/methylene tetrahydromethanopterin reductase-like flavin-dependent oxidoreductase (luciferase family)